MEEQNKPTKEEEESIETELNATDKFQYNNGKHSIELMSSQLRVDDLMNLAFDFLTKKEVADNTRTYA